ncbi:MAG: hypothetical protein WD749_00980 [Phycisphaerales bacterium]
MYTLTDRRLQLIKHVLDRYRVELSAHGRFHAGSLERDLRAALDTGYHEIKDLVCQLILRREYREVAAYYMQHIGGDMVVAEFQAPLASFYGVSAYNSPEFKQRSATYWVSRETLDEQHVQRM